MSATARSNSEVQPIAWSRWFPRHPAVAFAGSIDKKMIEILDANEPEPRILHVRHGVESNRESCGENQHMDPASRRGRRHAEAGEQGTSKAKAEQHDINNLRRMFFAGAEPQSGDLEQTREPWQGLRTSRPKACLSSLQAVVSGERLCK